ncbi:MAG: ABC transporter ATP-binding protein [Ruminococcaceae bacterium]|nr:ABC transporter ATP-binding protein [Oscillospiraceae bacterium]
MLQEPYLKHIALSGTLPANAYFSALSVVKHLERMEKLSFHAPITFFVGENGVGKSTLIEAIAVAMGFNPEGGTRNFRFSTESSHSELYRYLTVARSITPSRDGFFLRAESFYNVASYIDQLDRIPASAPPIIHSYGGVSLHRQSHGESFLSLVENRFGENGLYILDEPEAALSPARLMKLMILIHRLVEKNSQFIISTHSPILMTMPNAEIYQISQHSIESVSYRETEHYLLTKDFFDSPERMLNFLFSDEP